MKRTSINKLGVLGLLLLLWLGFTMVVSSPAWADDGGGRGHGGHGHGGSGDGGGDDDDDDEVTTTTLAPPTTTPPTTTTTTILAPTTTVRAQSTPSTTSPTTTTIGSPRDDQWKEQRLDGLDGSTTSTTSQPEPQGDFDSNETLVLSMVVPGSGNSGGGSGNSGGGSGNSGGGSGDSDHGGIHISPRQGLAVAFRTAVEVIEGHLVQAMLLGILVAAFVMAGVDKRQIEPPKEPAVSRFYSHHRDPSIR